MPTTKSAWKRMYTSAAKRLSNRATRSQIENIQKDLAAAAGDKEKVKAAMSKYFSVLDKAVKHGVIKKNTADRRKSRASRLLK